MRCRKCNSKNTRVVCTEHHETLTKRYCKCLDCKTNYRTIERYAIAKPIPLNPSTQLGTSNPNSKLTTQEVLTIRHLHQQGLSNGQLAIRFKQNRSTISRIVNYKTYSNII